ncbi:hypothetical protein BB560_006195, partial [Smittium megazygosporum]
AKDDLSLQGPQGGETSETFENVRRLRLGEIDPDPETKPARPDPVDMDEDEKEMLSEARARLANTQGKKAKRKARERQLEEAKRLASLQKHRELKAAGIDIRKKKKLKHLDYNADIPFEKKPLPGFFNTADELQNKGINYSESGIKLQDIEPKKRWQLEEEAIRKQQEKKDKQKKSGDSKNDDAVVFVKSKLDGLAIQKEQEDRLRSRPKLVLPQPQVSDNELQTIARIAQRGDQAQEFVASSESGSDALLTDYSSFTRQNITARTSQTPASSDSIMTEAINLIGLTTQQTPLLGEENTPFHTGSGTGFDGITPLSKVVQTPNPLLTPFRGGDGSKDYSLSQSSVASRTPFRDFLGLNTPSVDAESGDGFQKPSSLQKNAKAKLTEKLANLPKPKNQFEIVLPQDDTETSEESFNSKSRVEDEQEDMEVVEKRRAEKIAQEEKVRLEIRSTPVKKDLPRPLSVNIDLLSSQDQDIPKELKYAMDLIDQEIGILVKNDAENYPYFSSNASSKVSERFNNDSALLEKFSIIELESARALINEEFESIKQEFPRDKYNNVVYPLIFEDQNENNHLWVPSINGFVDPVNNSDKKLVVEGFKSSFAKLRSSMTKEAMRATKMEKKQAVMLGGYMERSKTLLSKIDETFNKLQESKLQLSSFQFLKSLEQSAIPQRISRLQAEVDSLSTTESELQQKYQKLVSNS